MPIPVDGEVYPGVAALGFTTKFDHNFTLEGKARFDEKARYTFLLFLLSLLATGRVYGAFVTDHGATLGKPSSTNFADMWSFTCVVAHVGCQIAACRKASNTARIIACVRFLS